MRRRHFAAAFGALPQAVLGALPLPEVEAFITAEYKRWGEVIRAAGITPQ